MNRFFTGLGVGIVGTALVCGIAYLLVPISAKGLTKSDQAIFDHVKSQCKADAKAKGLGLLDRRKFVANCVMDGLREHADLDPYDLD
jgi:hypothetical protein